MQFLQSIVPDFLKVFLWPLLLAYLVKKIQASDKKPRASKAGRKGGKRK